MVLSLGLLTRMGVTHLPEIQDALAQLLTRSWWLIVGALGLEVVWLVSLSNVYRSSIRGFGGNLGRWHALRISMGAFSLSRILPGGGAAGSVFAARAIVAQGNEVPRTAASMVVAWWVSMTTLALVVGVGTATGIPSGVVGIAHLAGPATVLGVLLLVGVAVLVTAGTSRHTGPVGQGSKSGRVPTRGERLSQGLGITDDHASSPAVPIAARGLGGFELGRGRGGAVDHVPWIWGASPPRRPSRGLRVGQSDQCVARADSWVAGGTRDHPRRHVCGAWRPGGSGCGGGALLPAGLLLAAGGGGCRSRPADASQSIELHCDGA